MRIEAPSPDNYPAALRAARRWINWRFRRDGEPGGKKPPCRPDGTRWTGWEDPEGWLTWEQATGHMADNPDIYLGFVLGADDEGAWCGVDLDDCRDKETGEVLPKAAGLLAFLKGAGAWVEVSPSGTGFKAFGRADSYEWVEVNYATDPPTLGGDKAARFFAVTGKGEGDPTATINLDAIKDVLAEAGATLSKERKEPHVLPDVIPPGSQNAMLFKEACVHVRAGKSKDEVFALIKAIQRNRAPSTPGAPPWTDSDLWAIVNSAMRYGPREDNFKNSESGDAEVFAQLHGDCVRYDCKRKRWLRYEGHRWVPQSALEVERLALDTVRWRQEQALRIEDPGIRETRQKWAAGGESSRRRSALLGLAKQELPIMDDGTRWDQDTNLMCFPNGVLELESGTFRPGRPEDSITKQAAAQWDPEASSELWDRVLTTALPDKEVREFLQMVAGLTIAGICEENILALIYGVTRSAKGTVLDALKSALGDYATTADITTLMVSKKDGGSARPDVMALLGARMVAIYEVGRKAKLDVTVVKTITGSDTISARALYGDQTEFRPTFVPWVATDTRPEAPHDDAAFYERLCEVPFNVYISPEKRDKAVRKNLTTDAAHMSAVLRWAWGGLQMYLKSGGRLVRPKAVVEANEAFRAEMDPVTPFLSECCTFDPGHRTRSADIMDDYKQWCRENNWEPVSAKKLGAALSDRGAKSGKVDRVRGWHGVGLVAPPEQGDF